MVCVCVYEYGAVRGLGQESQEGVTRDLSESKIKEHLNRKQTRMKIQRSLQKVIPHPHSPKKIHSSLIKGLILNLF